MSKFKLNDILNFDFNYTYTQTYDGAEQDNPSNTMINSQMVRIPRNIVNLTTNLKVPGYKDLNVSLKTKWSDEARDYGNGNANRNGSQSFADSELDSYLVSDLSITYNYLNKYNLYFDINNVLDKKYETAQDYSQMDRSFNFGIKTIY